MISSVNYHLNLHETINYMKPQAVRTCNMRVQVVPVLFPARSGVNKTKPREVQVLN